MSWRRQTSAALIGMFLLKPALGSELKVVREGADLGIVLQTLAYPPTLTKDLKSGLTTHLLIHLALLDDGRVTIERNIDVAVRYDLWDENFSVKETSDGGVLRNEDFAALEQVMSFLENLTVPQVLGVDRLVPNRKYTLRAQILLNPIEKDRMESLKRWVAENSASERPSSSAATEPLGRGASVPAAVAPPNSVFNQIFQQYASGVVNSATWHQTVISARFELRDLPP